MPGFSLLSVSETALILLLPTLSPLLPVPKNWFSLVKLLPDWNTFWPCFAAGFFLFFYPFRLPYSIFISVLKLLWSYCCQYFLRFFCPERRVQQIMCMIGRCFPALALQLIPWAFLSIELPFRILFSWFRLCFDSVVANIFAAFSLSRRTDSVPRSAISLVSFPNSPLQMFSLGFLTEGAPLWYFAVPYQNLLWSCCCQHFRCKLLSRGTGSALQLCHEIGKLSWFLPCGWFRFGFPSDRAFLYQTLSNRIMLRSFGCPPDFYIFLAIKGRSYFQLRIRFWFPVASWPFSFSLSLKTELSLSDYCESKPVLISLLQVSSKHFSARENWFTTILLTYNHLKNLFPLSCDSFFEFGFPAAQSPLSFDLGWSGILFRLF